jgi:ribosomal peptide maturation radical SAM protein 1
MRVLLVSMPFGALERQALGLSLLKACLTREGVACDVRYFTFDFAALLGADEYFWINRVVPYTAFCGDWCFTEALYGPRPETDGEYVEQVLRGQWYFSDADLRRLSTIRALTAPFLEHCLQSVDWRQYDLVGFTSTFEQNLASLALARRLRAQHPHLGLVFGGANWEGEMGLELHRQFPFVDYVCSGEAERSFPALVDRLASAASPADVPGIVYRDGDRSIATPAGLPIERLDELPIPDYADYFRDLEASGVSADVLPVLLFETARGCWWGAKSHCTFCGLNGGAMAFRAKSQTRALDELHALIAAWGVSMVESVDNILDMRYFQEFLPAVAREAPGLEMFFEVKANLVRKHLRTLAAAGVHRLQPGIESMSDHVLSLMRKGTTALQNIQMLKWCREYQIRADWNLLYGFPGETEADYRDLLQLLPAMRFLGPPSACGPLRLDRFSPYFDRAAEFGLRDVRALRPYRYLYPAGEEALARLAYYFDFTYEPAREAATFAGDVIAYVEGWRRDPELGSLTAIRTADGRLSLADTRRSATVSTLALDGLEQAAYEFCDRVHAFPAIDSMLRRRFPNTPFESARLRGFLDSAAANGLMVRQGDKYLSLALAAGSLRDVLEAAELADQPGPAAPAESRRFAAPRATPAMVVLQPV